MAKTKTKTEIAAQWVPIGDLTPWAENPRKNEAAVSHVAESIQRFGFASPIIARTGGEVIAGHTRLLAAQQLGLDRVPVRYMDLDPVDAKLLALADNKVAEIADWDDEALEKILSELKADGVDLDGLGWSDDELAEILNEEVEGLTDEDQVPEPPQQAVTVEGDLWILGDHRLLCGDSTKLEVVERLMDGEKADMVFTSPPYNANTKASSDIFNGKKSVKLYSEGYNDNRDSLEYVGFASNVLDICFQVTDGFIFWNVSYNANSRFEYIQQISQRLPWLIEQVCWQKSATIPFKGSMMRDWEPIYVFSTDRSSLGLTEVNSNIWKVSNIGSQTENHKACYPVELPQKGIALVAKARIVLDPFGGSGSTMLASEKLNRSCRMMELDPKYVDVIINRWQDFTGSKATLQSTGQTYDEMKGERLASD